MTRELKEFRRKLKQSGHSENFADNLGPEFLQGRPFTVQVLRDLFAAAMAEEELTDYRDDVEAMTVRLMSYVIPIITGEHPSIDEISEFLARDPQMEAMRGQIVGMLQ